MNGIKIKNQANMLGFFCGLLQRRRLELNENK